MGKRKTQNEIVGFGALLAVGAVALVISRIVDGIGFTAVVVVVIAIFALVIWYKIAKRAQRLAYLRKKYLDETIVQHIMSKILWRGETAEQVRDSIGSPSSVDKNLLKTRKREVWKYHPHGRGRYRTRVTLDDDVVIEIKTLGR